MRTLLGYKETQGRLTEEFSAVARDYCDISWGKALDVAGVSADSSLRRPESIYYDPDIRELSDPNSSIPEQTAPVSELPKVDQVHPAPPEVSIGSHQEIGKGKEAETLQGKGKGKDKKDSSKPAERPQTLLSLNPSKILIQGLPRQKLRFRILSFVVYFFFFRYVYCFCITFLLRKCTTFLLSMKMPFFCFIRHDK